MLRLLILLATHGAMLGLGFLLGIYLLPYPHGAGGA